MRILILDFLVEWFGLDKDYEYIFRETFCSIQFFSKMHA